ncbi:MAG TPA: BTAD domain-containing putative transcriptional regulator, partial [Roseiflexaceae bacterium]|nr:BTAD domain-containing putative transcriptional regulator [Roseiflexaceae bacterium]
MAQIKLYVFGPPRLEYNGQPINLNLRKALALLVYLAISGQPQSRDALAVLLWPESNQSEGRARLRRTLHRLQQALDETLLDVNPETIRVQPAAGLWIDSAAFRQHVTVGLPAAPDAALAPERLAHLEAAVALYNDHFLSGFTLPDSSAFDEWQFFQRESLCQLYGQVLEQLIAAHRTAEAWDVAIGYARRWVALDALHEPAQRTLMQLYAWAGQPAAAVRQYQECVRILDAELGATPEPETAALYEAIRTRQLGLPAIAARQSVPVATAQRDQLAAATLDAIRAVGTAEDRAADQRQQAQAGGASAPVVLRAPGAHTEADTLPESQSPSTPELIARQRALPQYREERRWVTVLSADLLGFASLAERLDPEDLKALANQCAERLSAEIHRFGGTVINIMGNTLLAAFGAPIANEDDAERAVRAGMAIRDLALITPGDRDERRIEVRVGINSGDVMAGFAGPEQRRDYTIIGGAVNSAAGLMRAGSTSAVVVGEETFRATRGRVRYRKLPPISTGERDGPIAAWEAIDAVAMPRARPLRTTPLVGRDEELALLLGMWARAARESRPQLITVLGEPGIGKSRLLAEFERGVLALGDTTLLHGRCLPYGEALGYGALSMALHEAAGVVPADDPQMARHKLGDLVADVVGATAAEGDPGEIARHLALLSGLDSAADRAAVQADERTLQTSVRRFLEALARRRPLCLLIEDIQWADETLLNLLEFVAARTQGVPLLIAAQARPELLERRPTWGGGLRAFMSLHLEPLDQDAGLALARALCHERGLPLAAIERVGRVAGGNPLFLEELIATIAERPDELGIPSAIKALIAARLDRLGPEERQIIARASVFGRYCWLGGLAALGVDGQLAEHLEALEHHDLIRLQPRSRFSGDREYAFKHDLIRDVAYQMLPRAERRRLHGQVADWLERITGERADESLDLLAHHAVQAEQHVRALGYLTHAAKRARRAAAHREEAALLAQAITIAERSQDRELLPELRARRGRAFASVALWADARRELESALAELPAANQERRAEVLLDLALACNWSMDTPALRGYASQALQLAEAVGRADLAMDARFWLAWAAGSEGQVASAVEQYQHILAQATALNVSPAPSVLPLYATTLCWAAQFDHATASAREAVQIARAANDTDATILGLQVQGLALAGTGRYDEASRVFEEAARFGREFGIGPFLARSIAMSAGFHLDVFDFDGHAALAEAARVMARSVGFPPPLISASIDLLLNFARRGEVARAEQLAGEVAGAVQKAVAWHGWLWRLRFCQARAEIALARGAAEQAIVLASEAFERSRRTRAKYQVLALVTRAQALGQLGRTREAAGDLRTAVQLA